MNLRAENGAAGAHVPSRLPPGSLVRRAGWTTVDQALSSISNLGVTFVVARMSTAEEFGAFALAYTTYVLAVGLSSAIASDPLVIRYARHSGDDPDRADVRSSAGTAIAAGALASVGALVAALVAGPSTLGSFLALAVVFPGLLLQDHWRYVFFAQGRPRSAAANDLVWVAGQALALLLVFRHDDTPSVFSLVLAWGVGASAGAVFGTFQAGARPATPVSTSWLRKHRDLIPQFVLDFLLMAGGIHITFYGVAVVAGLADAGGLRAGQALFGPIGLLLAASRTFALPEAVRRRRASAVDLWRFGRQFGMALASLALLLAIPICLLPDSFGEALLGDAWAHARPLLLPLSILTAARGATVSPLVGLRALEAANRILLARIAFSPLLLLAGITGALVAGAVGAAWGLAAVQTLGIWIWWRHYAIAFRRTRDAAVVAP